MCVQSCIERGCNLYVSLLLQTACNPAFVFMKSIKVHIPSYMCIYHLPDWFVFLIHYLSLLCLMINQDLFNLDAIWLFWKFQICNITQARWIIFGRYHLRKKLAFLFLPALLQVLLPFRIYWKHPCLHLFLLFCSVVAILLRVDCSATVKPPSKAGLTLHEQVKVTEALIEQHQVGINWGVGST